MTLPPIKPPPDQNPDPERGWRTRDQCSGPVRVVEVGWETTLGGNYHPKQWPSGGARLRREDDYHSVSFGTGAGPRHRPTVRLTGPLFHLIHYLDSQSGGRDSRTKAHCCLSLKVVFAPFHARPVNLDCKDIQTPPLLFFSLQAQTLTLVAS